jgi:hypothetical protein
MEINGLDWTRGLIDPKSCMVSHYKLRVRVFRNGILSAVERELPWEPAGFIRAEQSDCDFRDCFNCHFYVFILAVVQKCHHTFV